MTQSIRLFLTAEQFSLLPDGMLVWGKLRPNDEWNIGYLCTQNGVRFLSTAPDGNGYYMFHPTQLTTADPHALTRNLPKGAI